MASSSRKGKEIICLGKDGDDITLEFDSYQNYAWEMTMKVDKLQLENAKLIDVVSSLTMELQ